MLIEDGTGKGYKASVDSDQRLHTCARTLPAIADYSDRISHSYVYSTGLLTLPSPSPGAVFWMQNTVAQKIYIDRFWFFWNGGSTNYNRSARVDFYGCPNDVGVPSANENQLVAGNGLGNLSFANNSPGTLAYEWDEVSTGMTVPGDGTTFGRLGTILIPSGGFTMELSGAMVLGVNNTIMLKAGGLSEVGEFSVACTFFRKE